jgi:lipoprotein NlpI
MTRRTVFVVVLLSLIVVPSGASAQRGDENVAALMDRAISDFLAGRIRESVDGLDRVATLAPKDAPALWQRGIALYYAERYRDCRLQFESHRTVNPADVENAAWHFLCVAKQESPTRARAALLPVGRDPRRPMTEVYAMFRGDLTSEQVLKAAGDDPSARFYALLYVGLFYEAIGDMPRARKYITAASSDEFSRAGGFMNRVAKVHVGVRDW